MYLEIYQIYLLIGFISAVIALIGEDLTDIRAGVKPIKIDAARILGVILFGITWPAMLLIMIIQRIKNRQSLIR